MIDIDRTELKYAVDPVSAAMTRSRLSPYMTPDPHNGPEGYPVRSLYFDSLADTDFQQKLDGLDDRKKIRLRIYDPASPTAKLEVKEKHGGMQRKRSVTVSREEAAALAAGDYSSLRNSEDSFVQELWYLLESRLYRPKCIVEYDRFALISPDNETRITFDSGLRATEATADLFSPDLLLYPVAEPGAITMEVKYDHFLLSNIKRALSVRASMQLSVSKYVLARTVSKHGRR